MIFGGSEQIEGALFVVVWAIILWTRRDLKGISKKLGREQTKRRNLVTTIIESTETADEAGKRKIFTDYQKRED